MNQYCNKWSVNNNENCFWVFSNENIFLNKFKNGQQQHTKQRAACKTIHVSWIKSVREEPSPWHTLEQNNEVPAGV